MATLTLTIESTASADRLASILNAREGLKDENFTNIGTLISALNGGAIDFTDAEIVVGSEASGTITFTGAPTAAQTITINGVVFTARASGATGNEFNIGANVSESATNLANAWNASSTAATKATVASTALGVVTLRSKVCGESGLYSIANGLSICTFSAFALPSATDVRISF